jgi:hypothetical protein
VTEALVVMPESPPNFDETNDSVAKPRSVIPTVTESLRIRGSRHRCAFHGTLKLEARALTTVGHFPALEPGTGYRCESRKDRF